MKTESLAEIDFAILDKAFALANIDLNVNGDFVNLPYILLHEGNRFLVTDLNVELDTNKGVFGVGDFPRMLMVVQNEG